MGAFIKFLFITSILMSFVLAGITAFVLFLNMVLSLLFVTFSNNVISDGFALIGIWLPFDFAPIWLWLSTAAFAYLMYRFALISYTWCVRLIGKG